MNYELQRGEDTQLDTLIPAVFTHTETLKNMQQQAIEWNEGGEMKNYKKAAPAYLNID